MNFIGRYTDQILTLEVLREDLRDGFIFGFDIRPSYQHPYYDVYTEWNPKSLGRYRERSKT